MMDTKTVMKAYCFVFLLLCACPILAGCSHGADINHLQTPQQAGLGSGPKPGEITSTMKVYRHYGPTGGAPSAQSSPTNIK